MDISISDELLNILEVIRNKKYKTKESICKKVTIYKNSQLEINYIRIFQGKKTFFVKVIDLISNCSDYSPCGLLLWIQELSRFGFYDNTSDELFYLNIDNNELIENLYHNINKNWNRDNTCVNILNNPEILLEPENKNHLKQLRKNNIEEHYFKYIGNKLSADEIKCHKIIKFFKKKKLDYLSYIIGAISSILLMLTGYGILKIETYSVLKISFPLMIPMSFIATMKFYLARYENYDNMIKYVVGLLFLIIISTMSLVFPFVL